MPYQGTDIQAELGTLHNELAYTQKRLQRQSDPDIKRVLVQQMAQIRKDILHYERKKLKYCDLASLE